MSTDIIRRNSSAAFFTVFGGLIRGVLVEGGRLYRRYFFYLGLTRFFFLAMPYSFILRHRVLYPIPSLRAVSF